MCTEMIYQIFPNTHYGKKNGPIPIYCIKQLKFGLDVESIFRKKGFAILLLEISMKNIKMK
jgi:hypothetical protein